jgi:hypothetical protein
VVGIAIIAAALFFTISEVDQGAEGRDWILPVAQHALLAAAGVGLLLRKRWAWGMALGFSVLLALLVGAGFLMALVFGPGPRYSLAELGCTAGAGLVATVLLLIDRR